MKMKGIIEVGILLVAATGTTASPLQMGKNGRE